MKRIRLDLQYDGTDFQGWQSQPGGRTVQDLLERNLRALLSMPRLRVFGQGRTDAGVHALRQVVHFDCNTLIPTGRMPLMLNKHLAPSGVVALSAEEVPETFHA
ncbi:MAG: tRNA pseudouridine synthase A, partial [Candidatus Coatesbacteria bacterium]|nr:tRNA pseudouridine synthase A [Candidatus Coatesbacteria bacterium]